MDGNGADTAGKSPPQGWRQWLPLAGATTGLVAVTAVLIFHSAGEKPIHQADSQSQVAPPPQIEPTPPVPPIDLAAIRRRAWEKIAPRLLAADQTGQAEVDVCLKDLADFLEQRKQGIPKFSKEILSFSGKWQLVRGKLPYAAKDRHLRYLSDQFDKNVFTSKELQSALESTVTRYVKSLQSLENELLVQCRADISESDLAAVQAIPVAATNEAFSREFERLVKSVVSDLQMELGVGVTQTVASLVAADIAVAIVRQVGAAVATQLGVEGGILGAGAGASWATFGVSLVACIVADVLLDHLIKAAGYDPVKKVTAKVDDSLDKLRVLIVDGDTITHAKYDLLMKIAAEDSSPRLRKKARAAIAAIESSGRLGLRQDMLRLNELRARLRSEALKRLVLQGETL